MTDGYNYGRGHGHREDLSIYQVRAYEVGLSFRVVGYAKGQTVVKNDRPCRVVYLISRICHELNFPGSGIWPVSETYANVLTWL
jgi:hypothetical protein